MVRPFMCANCTRPFTASSPYQIYCSPLCVEMQAQLSEEIKAERLSGTCRYCQKKFRQRNENSRGSSCETCKYTKKKKIDSSKVKEDARWLKPKPKRLSFEEMNSRMEWKRVMDDGGWSHYLKGNRWDKI